MSRCNLKRHSTIWTGRMIAHDVLHSNLDETREQSVAFEQHANDFALLLDMAKQQNSNGCRIIIRLCRAKQAYQLSQHDVQHNLKQLVLVTMVPKKDGLPDIRALRDVTNGHGLVAFFQGQCDQSPG